MWRYADIALGLGAVSLLYYGLLKRRKKLNLPLPPGPKGAPLVGNLFQIPQEFGWETYHEWCKEYNTDILYLNIAGTEFIVLDTSKVATDLLETRSSLYSDRSRMPMINELMGWDFNIGAMPYGGLYLATLTYDRFFMRNDTSRFWRLSRRRNRRVAHHVLHPAAVKEYRPRITRSTRAFLKRLLDDPDPLNIIPHLRHLAGETMLSIAYGIQIQAKNDPYLEMSRVGLQSLNSAAVPGAFLVDSFPFLKYIPAWFPGASFKRKAHEWRKVSQGMLKLPFAEAKRKFESGTNTVSVVSTCLQKIGDGFEDDAFTEETAQGVAGNVFAGGSDTTVSAIASCILGLLEHPEVLKKAQAQVDSVVGAGNMPELEHESALPYITAIAHETMRWRVVTPIAIPHLLSAEDEYKGYRLPAGAVIVPNAWAMLHDETEYPDPFTFNPDRFINPETGQVDFTRARDPSHACWGFGRRLCPGRHMAFSLVWLAIASLVSVFDIEKAKEKVRVVGGDGVEREEERTVELTHDYISAVSLMPKPFKCVIKPRSKDKAYLISESLLQDHD
ncbi:hypothetical protein EST38_g10495 [Candolleomyces aberdarensis]|uniref:Cytochrome P450 n=1 Tax=Candolleomyces aberdarensis TaxID=2316362 RepID=A0A4Q2D783_9AGAR|nr:hypothetical protein EST38_g10495 [Candolleomyces aberdarensis]